MANERNALKAGLFIVVSLGLIIAIIVGIKGVGQFVVPMQTIKASFNLADDIGGLGRGDEVRVGGAKVGVVQSVEFIAKDDAAPMIIVTFSLPNRFRVHQDAVVAIQSTVTGVSVLNFSQLGTGPMLAPGESLTGRPSALTKLLEAGPDIGAIARTVRTETIPKVNDAIASYHTTAETATEFIRHIRSKIDPIVEKYYAVADSARSAMTNISELFGDTKADFRTTVANLRDATGAVKDKLPPLMDKVGGLVGKVSTAVDETTVALQDVKQIAANTKDITGTARSVIISNRGKIDGMIASLKATGDNLKNASAEIRRSPWRLLYKPGAGEMANLNLYDSARQFADGAGELNDAAVALRDALKDPNADQAVVQKLVEKLDKSFANFNDIEQQLWNEVKQ